MPEREHTQREHDLFGWCVSARGAMLFIDGSVRSAHSERVRRGVVRQQLVRHGRLPATGTLLHADGCLHDDIGECVRGYLVRVRELHAEHLRAIWRVLPRRDVYGSVAKHMRSGIRVHVFPWVRHRVFDAEQSDRMLPGELQLCEWGGCSRPYGLPLCVVRA